jgi:hypothetical protein
MGHTLKDAGFRLDPYTVGSVVVPVPYKDLDKATLLKVYREFLRKFTFALDNADSVYGSDGQVFAIIYISGHGAAGQEANYFLPIDFPKEPSRPTDCRTHSDTSDRL